jgi:hypothetical protein
LSGNGATWVAAGGLTGDGAGACTAAGAPAGGVCAGTGTAVPARKTAIIAKFAVKFAHRFAIIRISRAISVVRLFYSS